jgi:EF-P beta-lysylation protein EpmB
MQWRQIQRTNFNSCEELIEYLELDENNRKLVLQASKFILNLPRRLAAKIQKNTLSDPILRQFVPLQEEKILTLGFISDPVGDNFAQCTPKLLQKYEGRALLMPTSACAMHCRYCFRKNYPYESADKQFENELEALRQDPTIQEIILSGGDPLSLSNENLDQLLSQLEKIPHIKRVRFHTRFPIGIPERIDEGFLELLKKFPFQFWFIVHVNHPIELDEEVLSALSSICKLGIPVLNQAVLLSGVNDEEAVLEALFRKLANHGIFAYYLHQLDKVQGSAHFEVSRERGLALIRYLEGCLPGYAVPKYVQEVQGEPSKTSIFKVE